MPSIRQIVGVVAVGLVAVSTALPALPKLSPQARRAYEYGVEARRSLLTTRQNPATGLPDGLTDVDLLEFALTLEHLESAFYEQGFQRFPASDFAALGLSQEDITNLLSIPGTEDTHVITLTSAIAGAGSAPVQPCEYNFGFTDAAGMVATAAVLENIGVSAYVIVSSDLPLFANWYRSYLAAAPLVKTPGILTVAAQIATVEARHQTFIRTASKATAIPSAFDTPLGPRAVFSLAAGFISSCPSGSNLAITPFPALTMAAGANMANVVAGATVQLQSSGATGAMACAFVNGGAPGGAIFTAFTNGGCVVPQDLAGITYVHLASAMPANSALTDAITVAGPMVMTIS